MSKEKFNEITYRLAEVVNDGLQKARSEKVLHPICSGCICILPKTEHRSEGLGKRATKDKRAILEIAEIGTSPSGEFAR